MPSVRGRSANTQLEGRFPAENGANQGSKMVPAAKVPADLPEIYSLQKY
jgi:hypothetical protein